MIPAMANALGIDVGTTNVKVALVTGDGTTVAGAQRPLAMTRVGDIAEQDAELTWSELVAAVHEVTAAHPDEAAGVVAIGVCSQYSSVVPIDGSARPVAPMLMWQDHRGTDRSFEIMVRDENAFFTFVERHGIPPVGGGLSLAHILYLQEDRPDVHARTTAYVEAMDYVTARLTGVATASRHSTYMYQLCDNRTLDDPGYSNELVQLAGVDSTRLPRLIPVDAAVGPLLADVAAALGLPAAAVVYAGTNDTATAAVATGAFMPGRAGISIGTTSVLVDELDAFRVDLDHQLFAMPGPYPDRYVVCAENGLGGKVLEHVLRNLVYAHDHLGDHRADDPFAAVDRALGESPPGAGGVMFLPWLNGASAPRVVPGCGAGSSTCRSRRRATISSAPSPKGSRTICGRCSPRSRRSPARRSRRSRSSAARPARRPGARSWPTCSTGPSSRSRHPGSRSPVPPRSSRWSGPACGPARTSTGNRRAARSGSIPTRCRGRCSPIDTNSSRLPTLPFSRSVRRFHEFVLPVRDDPRRAARHAVRRTVA